MAEPKQFARRSLLAATLVLIAGLLSALVVTYRVFAVVPTSFEAGSLSEFAEVGVYDRFRSSEAVWLVHLPKGRLVALNSHCTAIPCLVDWLSTENMFRCPCQNCGFSMEGINIDGPAGRPLQRYKIVLHGQNIIVDKSVVFKQELGEGKLSDSYIDMELSATPKTN